MCVHLDPVHHCAACLRFHTPVVRDHLFGPLTHSHYRLLSLSGSKILKKAWVELSKESQARVIAVLAAPDLNAVSLGEEHMFTAAEAIVWVAAAGLGVAARAAAVARPLTNPASIRPVIFKVCASSKVKVIYNDVSAGKFLKGFLFSGGPMPKLERARGKAKATKKRAPPSGASGASTSAPLVLESDAPAAKKPYSIWHEAAYALDARPGDPRVLAHNIAMHNEELAQRAAALELAETLRESAAEQERFEVARTLHESAEQERFECAALPPEAPPDPEAPPEDVLPPEAPPAPPDPDPDEVPLPPMFNRGDFVQVHPVTNPGFPSRLATSAPYLGVVEDYNFVTRCYTVKPVDGVEFGRAQTKIPHFAVGDACLDGSSGGW